MDKFKTLFGMEKRDIKRTCVLAPVVTREILKTFELDFLEKGAVFSAGNNKYFTLVNTRIGGGFLGDAALMLAGTACERLILFGSCGAVNKKLRIGEMVAVEKALSQDSFIGMLNKRPVSNMFLADAGFLRRIALFKDKYPFHAVTSLTVGSLELEEQYIEYLENSSIEVVDMETSALYAVAQQTGKKAVSLMFISDILGQAPYYEQLAKREEMSAVYHECAKNFYGIIKDITEE